MAVKSIKLGQVWRQNDSNQDFLVTKVYSEVFSQFAVLRPAEVTAPVKGVRNMTEEPPGINRLARVEPHAMPG